MFSLSVKIVERHPCKSLTSFTHHKKYNIQCLKKELNPMGELSRYFESFNVFVFIFIKKPLSIKSELSKNSFSLHVP